MKTLLIFRHAKSSWKEESLPDHERPLSKRGKKAAPQMGKLIRDKNLLPQIIITSSAKRALNTAQLAAEAAGFGGEFIVSDQIYAFEPGPYLDALRNIPNSYQSVLLVGHNPALEELLTLLTGEIEPFPTAALAQVSLAIQSWEALDVDTQGELIGIWKPEQQD